MPRALLLLAFPLFAPAAVSFNRDIRPIMADTCFRCHGPDASSRMAGLRLDRRDDALKKSPTGATPIVPGDPDSSAIVQRVFANNARLMPPASAHKTLTAPQKQLIRQWVAEGANYEGHWAYQPLKKPAGDIDSFIRERLTREGWQPAAPADRRTLIRRVTLDLTGLPPTPEEVRSFINDTQPDAYTKLVDRLLASPRYAEKQAMYWLDAVRYADTCGFHGDNPQPAWPYRDYVLKALRENLPFDQFTREQLAGDLLPNATREQLTASAFNRLNRTSAEGGLQPKEYLAKYAADRVRTVASVWLGSTLGCAECHDHKFDPFTARDFYSMKAFFADIQETGLVPDRGKLAWGTQLRLGTDAQRAQLEELEKQAAAARAALLERAKTISTATLLERYRASELSWRYQRPLSARTQNGATLAVYNDREVPRQYEVSGSVISERVPGEGLMIAGGPNPDNETYTVTLQPGAGTWTATGVEIIQDESLVGARFARGSDRFVLSEVEAELRQPGLPARPLRFASVSSNFQFTVAEHTIANVIDGNPKTGWGATSYGEPRIGLLALRFTEPVKTTAQSQLIIRLRHDSDYRRATIGRFRLALSSAAYPWPEPEDDRAKNKPKLSGLPLPALRALETGKPTEDQTKALHEYLAFATAELAPDWLSLTRLETERDRADAAVPRVLVTKAAPEPAETRILPRGNFLDDSGTLVSPAIPAVFGQLDAPARATRLDLANWIVSPANPLTPRVYANRVWRQFFGAGLSKGLDDLGSQGELPTHLELLDWLAADFVEHRWDMKHLARTIVLSATYQQSATAASREVEEKDPDNRLLARQNRLRVDAESVRDGALAIAGLLTESFGGPSVRPYQPTGYLTTLNFPKRDYSESRGAGLYRRGLYTHWQRSFLHPSLLNFDAPTREECTVNRVNSNTPLQALTLLNDTTYVEAARVFAQHAAAQPAARRIAWAFERALSRAPSAEEQRILTGLYRQNLARFQAAPTSAHELLRAGEYPLKLAPGVTHADLAALTTVTRAILNLHEVITRN